MAKKLINSCSVGYGRHSFLCCSNQWCLVKMWLICAFTDIEPCDSFSDDDGMYVQHAFAPAVSPSNGAYRNHSE